MSSTNKNYALIVTVIASFLTPFMGSSINIALPTIALEFKANAILLGWIPTVYLLSLAVFLVPFGRIADIYGRKRVFTYGIIIFTISSLVAGFSISTGMLLLLRVFQGLGAAMIFGNVAAIIASLFPPGERGRALGISVTGVFLGLFLGPVLGGFLTQNLGWRSIFFLNVVLGLLSTLAVLRLRGEWTEAQGEKFDLPGSLVLGMSLVSLMYGLSELPTLHGFFLILGGLLGLVLFFSVESRMKSPVLEVKLFKNKIFTLHNLAAFINYCAGVPIVFVLSLYLQYIRALDPQSTGLLMAVQPVTMAIFSPLAGKLSDRAEPRLVASAGMAFTALGLAFLAFLTQETSLFWIISGLIILGLGFALFSSPNTNVIISSVNSRYYGVASATLSTMRVLGQMSGMGLAIFTLAIFVGSASIQPDNYGRFLLSARISFALFSFMSLLGIIASLSGKKEN
ncbi:MAG TPA: MFS transporter [Methanobacteriaceae archaeon]|nr:MFS transporter [Methanobacteriaceae archaeon]